MILVPAIDIIDGCCVRLSQGDYSKKKLYNENPVEVAKMFEDWGIKRLHLVDLDGAKAGKIINYGVLENIVRETKLVIDFGGGVKSDEDLKLAFDSGAQMVTGGSIAVKNPEKFLSWLQLFGSERIILGADHKEGKIAVSGWTEKSDRELINFLDEFINRGVKKIICTDISLDGMLKGPSTDLYKDILGQFPGIHLIASGGVAGIDDLIALQKAGIQEAIVGKAIYEGLISETEIKKFLIH